MRKLRILPFMVLTLVVYLFSFKETKGQVPFTSGNLVVLRVGDGSIALSDGTSPVFLDEYTSAGVLVQSIAMPTAVNGANQIFTLDGFEDRSGRETGVLKLSPDGKWLSAIGYNAPPLTLNGDANSTTTRTIALVGYNGVINTTTKLSDVGSGFPYSAITTNGTDIWACSEYGELRYTTTGSSTSTQIATAGGQFYQIVGISDNQLFISSSSGKVRIVGSGLPTTEGQTTTNLPGLPVSYLSQVQYFFADLNPAIPGNDVLYMSSFGFDTQNPDLPVPRLGLTKYSFDGTNWIDNGIIGTGADNYFDITGKVNGSTVTLYCTRKLNVGFFDGTTNIHPSPNGGGELVTLTDASGYNGTLTGTPTVLATAAFQTGFRGVAFAPEAPSVKVSAKAFLQGAYNTNVNRHKDVTTTWAGVLNANALTQPFNTTAFGNYNGGEHVSAGFFTSNAGATTDITDWVLVELRDKNNPATLVSRKAGFIREDGTIVGTDGNTLSISGAGDDSYYIVIRHRNHLAIRSANPVALNGSTATLYDFTTAQSQAYQNPSVPGNAAMATKDLPGTETGKFLLWGGNANGDGFIRASGASNVSDYLTLLGPLCLQGDFSKILNSVYRKEDMNLDGVVRASAALNVNDYITLLSTGVLGGNTSNIITAH